MKSRFLLSNLIFIWALALGPVNTAYSRSPGTSSHSETTSPSPAQDAAGETQLKPAPTDSNNSAPGKTTRRVAWRWLILGFAIGMLVGALAWRRAAAGVHGDTRHRRVV